MTNRRLFSVRLLSAFFVSVFFFTASFTAAFAANNNTLAPTDQQKQLVVEALESRVKPGGPGGVIGVYQNGVPLVVKAAGLADLEQNIPITENTIFHVASVSKQFTGFAVALLAQERKIDLDADIRDYLPYVPDFGATITVRHLLHNMSGLRDQWDLFEFGGQSYEGILRQQQILNMVARQQALNFAPGDQYIYSNTGWTLLADLVARVSGQSFAMFTKERIFDPLEMERSFFYDDVHQIVPNRAHSYSFDEKPESFRRELLNFETVGATSLHTTVDDLGRWAANFTSPVVGDAALLETVLTTGKLNDGADTDYAFGLRRVEHGDRVLFQHGGSDAGFRSLVAFEPATGLALAIITNEGETLSPYDIAEDLIAVVFGEVALKPGVAEAVFPANVRRAVVGTYLNDTRPALVIKRKGRGVTLSEGVGDPEPTLMTYRANGSFDDGSPQWGYYNIL
ncbi:MAG: serine hydrolase domain-containing protein [Pseudomonadota bacterium]